MRVVPILITLLRSAFRSRAAVELENLALRHQVNVLKRSVKHRPKLTPADVCCGSSSREFGVTGARPWLSFNRRRSSLGIVRGSGYFGPGKFAGGHQAGLRFPAR